jgi:hypothetical protein
MRFAAANVPVRAFFLSTCALVERVMSGYLHALVQWISPCLPRIYQRQSHGQEPSTSAGNCMGEVVALLLYYLLRLLLCVGFVRHLDCSEADMWNEDI